MLRCLRPNRKERHYFWKWIECEKQVKHYSNPVYKGFHSKVAAVDWLCGQEHEARLKLLLQQRALAKAKMPSVTTTVMSNENTMDVSAHSAAASEPPIPFVTAAPVPTPTAVPVNSTKTHREETDFSPVAEMTRLIASCSPDDMPQPPVCTCATCPYMSGEIMHIRRVLLARLYQTGLITAQHKD